MGAGVTFGPTVGTFATVGFGAGVAVGAGVPVAVGITASALVFIVCPLLGSVAWITY